MKFQAKIPFIPDMGSVSPINCHDESTVETKEANVLWYINSMRDHDGLPRLKRLPPGVEFVPTSQDTIEGV